MPSHKISPYIPQFLPINFPYKYKDFLRKNYSKAIKIRIGSFFTLTDGPSTSFQSQKLLKLTRPLKGLKRLSFHDQTTRKAQHNKPKIVHFMKKIRRVTELKYESFWDARTPFKTLLSLWMKHILHLNKFTYKLKERLMRHFHHRASILYNMKSFVKNLRLQPKITALQFRLPEEINFAKESLLQLQKYPFSLKNLEFYCHTHNRPGFHHIKIFSISPFKKIETLAFQFVRNAENITHLLDTLPSLIRLKKLDILIPLEFAFPNNTYKLDPQVFSKLEHLSLDFQKNSCPVTMFQPLDFSRLQSLELSLDLKDLKMNQKFSAFVRTIKSLRSLNVWVICEQADHDNLTKQFLKSAEKLEQLTSLTIRLFHVHRSKVSKPIPSEAITSLQKIFNKPVKMKEFVLEGIGLQISGVFQKLLNIIAASATNLTKLRLDTASFTIQRGQIVEFMKSIAGLENIQVLQIPCLEIKFDQLLIRFTSEIMKLKQIRSVHVGDIGWKVDKQTFLDSVERILEKRGVSTFGCQMMRDLERSLKINTVYPRPLISQTPTLSLENIMRKNPFLKSVHKCLYPILNQDDDDDD